MTSAEYVPLHDLVSELGLQPGGDYEKVTRIASRIHHARRGEGKSLSEDESAVSRTSIFCACVIHDEAIRKLLHEADLDIDPLLQDQLPKEFKSETAPIRISERMAEGLRRYVAECPNRRTVDARALAYATTVVDSGQFEERFQRTGGDLPTAAFALLAGMQDRVDFTDYDLEPHVERALIQAARYSRLTTVSAADLLHGAHHCRHDSSAFRELDRILKGVKFSHDNEKEYDDHRLMSSYPLSEAVRESLEIGDRFFPSLHRRMWGRDYATIALFARDPSLDDLAYSVGASLGDWRDRWFEFLTRDADEKDHKIWQEWWRAARPPAPDADDDSAGDAQREPEMPSEEDLELLLVVAFLLVRTGSAHYWLLDTLHVGEFQRALRKVEEGHNDAGSARGVKHRLSDARRLLHVDGDPQPDPLWLAWKLRTGRSELETVWRGLAPVLQP